MTATQQIAIYGAGDFGQELAWLVQECGGAQASFEAVCLVDDDAAKHGKVLGDLPVVSLAEARRSFPKARVVGGVGNPTTRETLMVKAAAAGFDFATLVHPRVERSSRIRIGAGTIICAGSILTTNIVLGRHVQINLGCTIGHDAVMGDFATLAPGVHISGCVHVGNRAYVGTGAVTVHGTKDAPLVIGDDAVVGAGACVTKSVPPGVTVVGVPARPIRTTSRSPMAEPRPVPVRVRVPIR